MLGITNSNTFKPSGAAILVTAPVGAKVVATNGTLSYERIINFTGYTTFNGLEEGTWTLTASAEGQVSVVKRVTVKSNYTATITFFSAQIRVTYPAGSICTITSNGETQPARDTSGTFTFEIIKAGTYVIKSTDGTYSDTKTISITSNGEFHSINLSYSVVPQFTYTGDYQLVNDSDTTITVSKDNWKIRFLTSGTFSFTGKSVSADIFLVGGGAAGGYDQGAGGGSGYTKTFKSISLVPNVSYTVTVGAGGARTTYGNKFGNNGGASTFAGNGATYTADAGKGGGGYQTSPKRVGGAGGSGGGGGGEDNKTAGNGGSDGGNGLVGTANFAGGAGQGSTTREFGTANARLYAGGGAGGTTSTSTTATGGAGGGGNECQNGVTNTGGGGGGGGYNTNGSAYAGNGGSGIVIIRNARGG